MTTFIPTGHILLRLAMACLFSGLIGYEREYNSRPAGARTHILVCVGATLIAMIQICIINMTLDLAAANPNSSIIRSDPARLICQIVSGVGFLGAGTIVITKNAIRGLTTAASLWATAGLGIAIGMGYYQIAVISFVVIIIVLTRLKYIIHIQKRKHIHIKYQHLAETQDFILNYFKENKIMVYDSNFSLSVDGDSRIYTTDYTVDLPKEKTYAQIAEGLCVNRNITHISLINL